MIDIAWLRKICLPLPGVSEQIQWGNDLLFKVGGRMFVVAPLEPAPVCLSFKCSDESFADLTERPNILPAPYLARAKWVALENPDALTRAELTQLLEASYQLVFAKLSKRDQEKLQSAGARAAKRDANGPNKNSARKAVEKHRKPRPKR